MSSLLIYAGSHDPIAEEIARRAPNLDVLAMDDAGAVTLKGRVVAPEAVAPAAVWADTGAFYSKAARAFFAATLASPNLRWVQSAAAGFDHPMFRQIVAKGARLTISHGQTVGIADYVLWGVLDCFQRGADRRRLQAAHDWNPQPYRELQDTRWLVIGFGAIGEGVARRARGFGANITGVRRLVAPHPLADEMISLDSMRERLPLADVVVLCTPLTPATRGLADAAFFAAMKPRSVLVNVGRGDLVDETALLAALETGAPAHAVLDVFSTEPLPRESPFWDHPKVTLTPHASDLSNGANARNTALFLDNLQRFVEGGELLNLADPKDVLAT